LQDGALWLRGRVGSLDGAELLKAELTGNAAQAEALGRALAERLLDMGAGRLLAQLDTHER